MDSNYINYISLFKHGCSFNQIKYINDLGLKIWDLGFGIWDSKKHWIGAGLRPVSLQKQTVLHRFKVNKGCRVSKQLFLGKLDPSQRPAEDI